MNNIETDEKSKLIDQIISIMYENSSFKDFGMSKFLESTLKEHLHGKTLEELRDEYKLLQTSLNGAKKR